MKFLYLLIPVIIFIMSIASAGGTDPSRELMNLDMGSADAYEQVKVLLDSGASANAWADTGDRAIFRAVKSGNREIVKLLLDRGADPDVSFDDATGSALDFAVSMEDPEMVKLLISHRASVNYKMRGAHTALHRACTQKESEKSVAVINILMESGADVNSVTHMGITPLMNAVEAGNTTAVKILLQYGADPRIRDMKGRSAIDIAVSGKKNPEIMNLLKSWKKKEK